MTDYDKELDELLENYANAVYMSTEENGSIEDVYKAKAKLSALLRRVEVGSRTSRITNRSEAMIPTYSEGKKIGELPLATEYRILLDLLLIAGESDRDYARKQLKKLDTLTDLVTTDPETSTDVSNPPSGELEVEL